MIVITSKTRNGRMFWAVWGWSADPKHAHVYKDEKAAVKAANTLANKYRWTLTVEQMSILARKKNPANKKVPVDKNGTTIRRGARVWAGGYELDGKTPRTFKVKSATIDRYGNTFVNFEYGDTGMTVTYMGTQVEVVKGRGKNPVPPSRFQGKSRPAADAVAAAGDLFRRFTGHEPHKRPRMASDRSRAWLRVGTIDGILYTTNRDNGDGGEVEQYIHRFHPGSRPELLVDQDGKTFRSHGGQFTFTDRGFVDENKQGKAIE